MPSPVISRRINRANTWRPLSMPGAAFWNPLELASVTKDGSNNVSNVADLGPGAFAFQGGTAPLYSATGINGRPAISFTSASNHRLIQAGDMAKTIGFTAFVFQPTADISAASTLMSPVGWATTAANGTIQFGPATALYANEYVTVRNLSGGARSITHASNTIPSASPHWLATFFDGTDWRIYLDDPSVDLANATNGTPGVITAATARWGEQVDGTANYNGMCGSVLAATSGTIADVYGWDAWVQANYGF